MSTPPVGHCLLPAIPRLWATVRCWPYLVSSEVNLCCVPSVSRFQDGDEQQASDASWNDTLNTLYGLGAGCAQITLNPIRNHGPDFIPNHDPNITLMLTNRNGNANPNIPQNAQC